MPIAFDASVTATHGSTTALSWSHTCSGTDRALVVGVHEFTVSDSVTGCTYAGLPMTLVSKAPNSAGQWSYLFYLAAPPAGANTVVASASTPLWLRGNAMSYTGVKAGAVHAVNQGTYPSNDPIDPSVVTTKANCWVVCVGKNNGGVAVAGANTVVRQASGSDGSFAGDSNGPRAAGTNILNFGFGSATTWSVVMIAMEPAPQHRMFAVF